jgi:hypothetical protein
MAPVDVEWAKAKALLEDDLLKKTIPTKSSAGFYPKDIHQMRDEYAAIPYKTFASRLSSIRRRHHNLQSQATTHAAALERSRSEYPIQSHNERGQLRWEGSDAAKLLAKDIAEGKHHGKLPAELRASRPEYMEHDPNVFRRRIYQTENTQKYISDQKAQRAARSSGAQQQLTPAP